MKSITLRLVDEVGVSKDESKCTSQTSLMALSRWFFPTSMMVCGSNKASLYSFPLKFSTDRFIITRHVRASCPAFSRLSLSARFSGFRRKDRELSTVSVDTMSKRIFNFSSSSPLESMRRIMISAFLSTLPSVLSDSKSSFQPLCTFVRDPTMALHMLTAKCEAGPNRGEKRRVVSFHVDANALVYRASSPALDTLIDPPRLVLSELSSMSSSKSKDSTTSGRLGTSPKPSRRAKISFDIFCSSPSLNA